MNLSHQLLITDGISCLGQSGIGHYWECMLSEITENLESLKAIKKVSVSTWTEGVFWQFSLLYMTNTYIELGATLGKIIHGK